MRRLWWLLAVMLVACEPQPTPIELLDDQVQLNSMLVAGDTMVAVLITRARSVNSWEQQVSHPVTGATVTLRDGNNVVALVPQSDTLVRCVTYRIDTGFGFGNSGDPVRDAVLRPGCYVARVPGGIRHGATYALHATVPGPGLITGSATVPESPAIRSPESGATLAIPQSGSGTAPVTPLAWNVSATPAHTMIGLRLSRAECYGTLRTPGMDHVPNIRLPVSGRDSVDLQAGWVDCNNNQAGTVPASTYEGELIVAVFDANYARFVLDLNKASTNTREVSFGVVGAAGIFAATAIERLPVVLRRMP